jgi:hypothetical protein
MDSHLCSAETDNRRLGNAPGERPRCFHRALWRNSKSASGELSFAAKRQTGRA